MLTVKVVCMFVLSYQVSIIIIIPIHTYIHVAMHVAICTFQVTMYRYTNYVLCLSVASYIATDVI